MKIFLNGLSGRCNQVIARLAKEEGISVCTGGRNPRLEPELGLQEADVAIDFSFHKATLPLTKLAARLKKPLIIATTGHSQEEKKAIKAYATQIPIIWSGNYAIGVNVFFYAVRKAAERLGPSFQAEIIETHHALKKDSPSGTALALSHIIEKAYGWGEGEAHIAHSREGSTGPRPEKEIGMHSIRAGDIVGEHRVLLAGPSESIELTQRAHNREPFARGALLAARWVLSQAPGLYDMQDVLNLKD